MISQEGRPSRPNKIAQHIDQFNIAGFAVVDPTKSLGISSQQLNELVTLVNSIPVVLGDGQYRLQHLRSAGANIESRDRIEQILGSKEVTKQIELISATSGLEFSDPIVNELAAGQLIKPHIDQPMEGRKLIVGGVLHLAQDYEGGAFSIKPRGRNDWQIVKVQPGWIVLFDETLEHKVDKVLSGTRRTLAFSYSTSWKIPTLSLYEM